MNQSRSVIITADILICEKKITIIIIAAYFFGTAFSSDLKVQSIPLSAAFSRGSPTYMQLWMEHYSTINVTCNQVLMENTTAYWTISWVRIKSFFSKVFLVPLTVVAIYLLTNMLTWSYVLTHLKVLHIPVKYKKELFWRLINSYKRWEMQLK